MQIETTFRYYILLILIKILKYDNTFYWWGCQRTDTLLVLRGKKTGVSLLVENLETSNKTIKHLTFGKVVLLLVVYPEGKSPKIWNVYAKFIDYIVCSFKIMKTNKMLI